jgi:hypothetical protein
MIGRIRTKLLLYLMVVHPKAVTDGGGFRTDLDKARHEKGYG